MNKGRRRENERERDGEKRKTIFMWFPAHACQLVDSTVCTNMEAAEFRDTCSRTINRQVSNQSQYTRKSVMFLSVSIEVDENK